MTMLTWKKKKLNGLNGKQLRGAQNHKKRTEGLAVQMWLHGEKTLQNAGKGGTNPRQRGKGRKMAHTTMISENQGRNPSQKSVKRKRTWLGAMIQRETVNQRRVRSRSQIKKSGSLLLHRHHLRAHLHRKVQSQIWKHRVKKSKTSGLPA